MKHLKITKKLCAAALLIALLTSLLCLPIGATKPDGTIVSYQVTDGAEGSFSLRLLAGTNSVKYEKYGYEIKLTTKDAEGNDVTETYTGESNIIYSSVYGGGSRHSVKECFGYEYAAIATVTGLDTDSQYTKIEASAYFVLSDGSISRGADVTLYYTGTMDQNGYPLLSTAFEPNDPTSNGSKLTALETATKITSIDWNDLKG